MAAKTSPPKRANRTLALGETVAKALDPALKKRGFAGRDLLAHWSVIAPEPYGEVTLPDRLVWPRAGGPAAEGATLVLRCREGHAMAVEHEGERIAAAVNRYFGYFLVAGVRPAALPLEDAAPVTPKDEASLSPAQRRQLAGALGTVDDEGLRQALERLGEAVMRRRGS